MWLTCVKCLMLDTRARPGALPLSTCTQRGETMAALRSLPAVAYGLTMVLLVTPLFAPAVAHLPLQPPEMATGLAVLCCMPTTL